MKRSRNIIGILFLLISSMLSAQNELGNYLQTAAENNPGLKAKFSDYLAAMEVAPQVKALPDPQIAFAYFIRPVETRVGPQEFRFSASQMFPWFGTLKARENVAIQNAKVKYELFQEAKSRLYNEIRSAYFNIYLNRRAIEISTENINILNSFQKLVIIKVEAAMVSAVDEYRIEMEIGDLENQLASLRDMQNVLEVMFNNLLNTKRNEEIITPEILWNSDITISKEQVLDSIAHSNHQLLSLSLQQEALNYRKEIADNLGKPSFSIGLDYTFIGKGSNSLAGTDAFVFPKVGITIPLYRNKYKAMVNEVVYLQESKEFEKSDKENLLVSVVENTWKEYKDADRRIHLYAAQLSLARQSITLLEIEYSTGNENFEEILRMDRRVLKYNLELEKARADKQAAISFMNYLMGK
ncbi:MAG: TolC family protein [Bacteroidales bacterium]|nr:TolC family protein [Bacteroidales bacterium]